MNWHTFSAGASYNGPEDKYSWAAYTDAGSYFIDPISRGRRHVGYIVRFANDKGRVNQSGLYRDLHDGLCNLQTAKRLCRQHYQTIGV